MAGRISSEHRGLIRLSLLGLLVFIIAPVTLKAATCSLDNVGNCPPGTVGVSVHLRLVPTKLVVTSPVDYVHEEAADVQFTATAKYDGYAAPIPIPDKDVTADPDGLTTWSSSDPNTAIVNTIGQVRPIHSSSRTQVIISATYGGVSGSYKITVLKTGGGVIIENPPPVVTPPAETPPEVTPPAETPPEVTPPAEAPPEVTPPAEAPPEVTPPAEPPIQEVPPAEELPPEQTPPEQVPPPEAPPEIAPIEAPPAEVPPTEVPPTEVLPTEQTLPTEVPPTEVSPTETVPTEVAPSTVQAPTGTTAITEQGGQTAAQPGEQTPTGETVPEEKPAQQSVEDIAAQLPASQAVTEQNVLPLSAVFKPEDLVTPAGHTSRSAITTMLAKKMRIFELRKPLLDRCYADLKNCTNIFRMYSHYDGINLDPAKLKLFPDTGGLPEEQDINNMALLGMISGYYGIEQSPFLPGKPILRIEALKIMTAGLNILEKGQSDYKPEGVDYSSLFYQEVYGASLLSKLSQDLNPSVPPLGAYIPGPLYAGIRVAHALTDQMQALIRAQKTPFADVRPDTNDAHWYYPIVLNKICALNIIPCEQGSELKPDENPTIDEINAYLDSFSKYISEHKLDEAMVVDSDKDGLLNVDENNVYFTDPMKADTDDDKLNDGDEVLKYKTNPNKPDTDDDGLTDGDEVLKYKTNPNLYDTDGDGFSDGAEVAAGSDPLDKNSTPQDKNSNGIADQWELKYNIQVKDGSQDTDGDGVSDKLEYIYKTDPTKVDSDMDGYTDAEELFTYHSDPNDPKDPGDKIGNMVIISNFQYGQVVADPSPMIKGVGPASLGANVVKIQVLLRNEFGSELMLGETETDAKGNFIYIPGIEIKDGTYFLVARALNKGQVISSEPMKILIDSSAVIAGAKPQKLENVPITDDVLLKKLVMKVDSKDGRPVLYGTLSEFGSKVNVTWQSLVVSSALIVDTTDGVFSIKAPLLPAGRHTVYIQTIRKSDNAMSRTIKINFDLGLIGPEKAAAQKNEGLTAGIVGIASSVTGFVTKQSWPFWIAIVAVVLLGGGVYYVFFAGEKPVEKKKKK